MLVPDRIRNCAAFIGIKDVHGRFLPRATGFFVTIEEHGFQWCFLTTAEHVVSGLLAKGHDLWLRTNNTNGSANEERIPPGNWIFHPPPNDGELLTDVALCQFNFEGEDISAAALNGRYSVAGTSDILREQNIGLGEEVAIVGLFRSHHGRERNIPIVRIGNIAMMKGEPVETAYCGYIEAYLIEARSIGGLSGSPVFISIPPVRIIDGQTTFTTGAQFYLLGLVHGHFDIKNLNQDIVLEDEQDSSSGINTGIGVVIPVEKIIDTIYQHEQIEMRRKLATEHRKKNGAVADLADDPPANDANPTHREDFMRLVGAAAQKPEPKD